MTQKTFFVVWAPTPPPGPLKSLFIIDDFCKDRERS